MSAMNDPAARLPGAQMSLFDAPASPVSDTPTPVVADQVIAADPDRDARDFATDPRHNVVLEASAGTGKTSVLVWRFINLLKAGVEPGNILAITFTRKAAAEMRERIIRELKEAAARSEIDKKRWTEIRGRLDEIAISTIDAFCLSLLREFPLEADLDPGFDMADETEVPRLVEESLDRSLRIFAGLAREDADVALVLAQLGVSRTREGLASLLERRLVAWSALDRFLARGPADLTSEIVCRRAATALQDALRAVPGGLARFLADGPVHHARFQFLVRDLGRLAELERAGDAQIRAVLDRVSTHFLTADGKARRSGAIPPYKGDRDYPSAEAAKRHRAAAFQVAPHVERVVAGFARDLNVVLARGIKRMFAIALAQYRKALDDRSILDFSDVLQRALDLLRRMDEFSQSRFRLESRYHHVLVDEFQDTSRAQWELVSLLIQSWGEGLGLATQPSIFIVGDRKQSIYRFRDAEVAVLQDAARYIEGLRPAGSPRRSISRSFRALPELLEFVNELFGEMSQQGARPDEFTYRDSDRFPVASGSDRRRGPVLGLAVGDEPEICAAAVAQEVLRILREETVRDRKTGVPREARPGDIAILFRSRTSHREFEHELEIRGIPTYVYKGLGFFDADEIKDVTALLRYLADPGSDLRAAAFLRSRFVRLSDGALARLGPKLAEVLTGAAAPTALQGLDAEDQRVLLHVRAHVGCWIDQVDRVPPADLIASILPAASYAYELRGPRHAQAWENLKKIRSLIRRIQNRGYATLGRIADHIDSLTAGDESNAVIEALDAVNLMTVHASKGLEFPIVFVVNLARGATGPPRPVRIVVDGEGEEPSVSIGPFVSETDEMEREREKQETRRLLYVAMTRARDRLYLSTTLKDGVVAAGRGSLAEVLPDSLKQLFAHAATAFEECAVVGWAGQSGRSFDWRICRALPELAGTAALKSGEAVAEEVLDVFGAVTEREPAATRVAVSEWLNHTTAAEPALETGGDFGDLVTGILVHRLIESSQVLPVQNACAPDAELALAKQLLRPEERARLADADSTIEAALSTWRAIRSRPDVVAILASGWIEHEVPFSLRKAGDGPAVILRGTIDALIHQHDGGIVVLEFKTGRRRPAHQAQLDTYVQAARALFPDAPVRGMLVYPE
jgi:ATP-dependent helicase/nuclease subunit A